MLTNQRETEQLLKQMQLVLVFIQSFLPFFIFILKCRSLVLAVFYRTVVSGSDFFIP